MRKFFLTVSVVLILAIVVIQVSSYFSPFAKSMLVRLVFNVGATVASHKMEGHVPEHISERLDVPYDATDKEALLDIFSSVDLEKFNHGLPTIVWTHGGGWVSGNKSQVRNYAKILASKGFTVVAIDYSVAPGARYPTPVRQALKALSYLNRHAAAFKIDPKKIFLAGDSAGAQITAQVANILSSPEYARAIGLAPTMKRENVLGLLLYCGIYDPAIVDVKGGWGSYIKAMMWSYFGKKDFQNTSGFKEFSVVDHMTHDFPPFFVTVGNGDTVMPQSLSLVRKAESLGVRHDMLFFEAEYSPKLKHEYQFDLDSDAGKQALQRALAFMNARLKDTNQETKSLISLQH
ncbi:alpha/beta hydrolase [Bdellovibrio sp. NC01]|uniref:alpha/beta hydrolase n=1 Tax=Bdellovibrio sp. NC01 TaxID=2220073 RepID=UPI00143D307D|nr:alpha/beta hydrolase [Bdellovibrio sp. NC01]